MLTLPIKALIVARTEKASDEAAFLRALVIFFAPFRLMVPTNKLILGSALSVI
jgi:hypothetical protein